MVVPFLFPAIALALIAVVIQVIIWQIGKIIGYYWGTNDAGITNKDLTEAGNNLVKSNIDDCIAPIEANTSLSQDDKVSLISLCHTNNIFNWLNQFQSKVYPDADHTPLNKGITDVQNCQAVYGASAKTAADYEAFKTCSKGATDKAITDDITNTAKIYNPDAPATQKQAPSSGISSTVILIGVGLLAAYLLTRPTTKRIASSGYKRARQAASGIPGGLYRISRGD